MSKDDEQKPVNFNIDMNKVPNPQQQSIVASVALTKAQAKELVQNLTDNISKFGV